MPEEYTGLLEEITGETDVLTGGGPRFTGVQSGKTVLVADPPDRDVVDIPAILTVGKETVGEVEIPLQTASLGQTLLPGGCLTELPELTGPGPVTGPSDREEPDFLRSDHEFLRSGPG